MTEKGTEDRGQGSGVDASCYAHVVRRVRELIGCELPENYLAAAASPERWAHDIDHAMKMPQVGDVVEMSGQGNTRHVGVMISGFEMEHVDVRRGTRTRVPLRLVYDAGVVVRILRPFRRIRA